MPLPTGARIGPYEVIGALDAGGMGEVYRARDTKLGRDVALKILLAQFTRDRDRLELFQREARVLGALNHPQIATIYGLQEIDDQDGGLALVMEFIDGVTLGAVIARATPTPHGGEALSRPCRPDPGG